MSVRVWTNLVANALLCFAAATFVAPRPSIAQSQQITELGQRGLMLAKQFLEIARTTFGDDHPEVAQAHKMVAKSHQQLGQFKQAAEHLSRGFKIIEAKFGPEAPQAAAFLEGLGLSYYALGRYKEAESAIARAYDIAVRKSGATRETLANLRSMHGRIEHALGRYDAAERHLSDAVEMMMAAVGKHHPRLAPMLDNLSEVHRLTGRYVEAKQLKERAVGLLKGSAVPASRQTLAIILANFALLHQDQGDFAAAEPMFKESIDIMLKWRSRKDIAVARILNNLATLYWADGRFAQAEDVFRRVLSLVEKALGANHPEVATALNNLSQALQRLDKVDEIEPLMLRALAIMTSALGADHPEVANLLSNLAIHYSETGRSKEAREALQRAIKISQKSFGPAHPMLVSALVNLGDVYLSGNQLGPAEQAYRHALDILQKTLPKDHPRWVAALSRLGDAALKKGQPATAIELYRRAGKIAVGRMLSTGSAAGGRADKRELKTFRSSFLGLVRAAHHLTLADATQRAALTNEAFQAAQWAIMTDASAALARMAARYSGSDAKSAALVRKHQDLVNRGEALEKQFMEVLLRAPDARDENALSNLRKAVAQSRADVARSAQALKSAAPRYAALSNPTPLNLEATRSLLHDNEAVVLILSASSKRLEPAGTFVWIITKTESRWARSELDTAELAREVSALRCGLDRAAWYGKGARTCADRLGIGLANAPKGGDPLPYSLLRAHKLYERLFAGVTDLLTGRHLLFVPTGALTQLPLQVLITAPPDNDRDFATAAWLAKSHVITVLPAVSSLGSLRHVARSSSASKPLIAFANPLLTGRDGNDKRAWAKQTCSTTVHRRPMYIAGMRIPEAIAKYFRGGRADPIQVRQLDPLPETTDEVCAVARSMGALEADLWLGARATERNLKRLSEAGQLAQYRVLHMATHALVAGELDAAQAEPAIVLTPPDDDGARTDLTTGDGLLTSSEIMALKLDADWVVLSACNTAAGGLQGGEALSGLARAFFFAGARALLVSHWQVNSQAAVELVTKAFEAQRRGGLGRAAAVRQAMLETMKLGGVRAHPEYWAPFVIVGEGSSEK
jgi:CHAT domain-containing protein/tetratricopeptide (TPR) repeat protein